MTRDEDLNGDLAKIALLASLRKDSIDLLALRLSVLLKADCEECVEGSTNWQAEKAREVCDRLLASAKADGMHGCRLCQG